jgi:hypothetical protein
MKADVGNGEPVELGEAEAAAAGWAEGETADFDGVGVPLGFTSTSAAKRVPRATKAAAKVNQNLNIACLRNAVLALSQD